MYYSFFLSRFRCLFRYFLRAISPQWFEAIAFVLPTISAVLGVRNNLHDINAIPDCFYDQSIIIPADIEDETIANLVGCSVIFPNVVNYHPIFCFAFYMVVPPV